MNLSVYHKGMHIGSVKDQTGSGKDPVIWLYMYCVTLYLTLPRLLCAAQTNCNSSRTDKQVFPDNLGIIYFRYVSIKTYAVGTHYVFLWRIIENYP